MTGGPGEEWKIFADGDDCENIPLWKALAQFTSDDLDEGLKVNAAVINQAKPPFARYYNGAFLVSMVFGFLFHIPYRPADFSAFQFGKFLLLPHFGNPCHHGGTAYLTATLPIWLEDAGHSFGPAARSRSAF